MFLLASSQTLYKWWFTIN